MPHSETLVSESPRTFHVGTRLHDAQHDPLPSCVVCGAESNLRYIERATQTPAGMRRRSEPVCLPCLERAVKSLGDGRPTLQPQATCVACPPNDRQRFAVHLVWPLQSFAPAPYWPVCSLHLDEALDALARDAAVTTDSGSLAPQGIQTGNRIPNQRGQPSQKFQQRTSRRTVRPVPNSTSSNAH
jgi:hypothetical protein